MIEKFYEILEYVRDERGVDFSAYRQSTIKRRLAFRLQKTGMPDYASYHKYIKENPKELKALIDDFTIKVSRFFRNPFVFEVLGEFVLPDLVEVGRDSGLRIWCAGCARGEEAYSVAIILKEIISKEAAAPGIFIIATDIDREALADAERAVYKSDTLQEIKKGYLDRYFIREDDSYRLTDDIRSMVTFAYHDVTTCEPPKEGIFSDYHLILCRNVFIYFENDLQKKVMKGMAGFLTNKGCLVLGEAESIPAGIAKDFHEIVPRSRIFVKEIF